MSKTKGKGVNPSGEFDPIAYAKQKEELMKFYEEEIPFLEMKAKYEGLLTEIDIAEMTRIEIMMKKGQIMEAQRQAETEANEKVDKTPKKD